MIRKIFSALALATLLAGPVACPDSEVLPASKVLPDPTELGHKPKQQIDKAQRAVNKAEANMAKRTAEAAKLAEQADEEN